MTRPNGLDVPEAVVALIKALPFDVAVWPASPTGRTECLLVEGFAQWGARAGHDVFDGLRGSSYGKATLREAVLYALKNRMENCQKAAAESNEASGRARKADRKRQAADLAAKLRAEAALIRETGLALETVWTEVSP